MMKLLILIILAIIILFPSAVTAQDGASLADCSQLASPTVLQIYANGAWHNAHSYAGYNLDIPAQPIGWLGYAPRTLPNYKHLETLGIDYGYDGINFADLGTSAIIYLYDHHGAVERYTVTEYQNDAYFIVKTTLYLFARSDGTAYDYHGQAYPDDSGRACVWLVGRNELDNALNIGNYYQ